MNRRTGRLGLTMPSLFAMAMRFGDDRAVFPAMPKAPSRGFVKRRQHPLFQNHTRERERLFRQVSRTPAHELERLAKLDAVHAERAAEHVAKHQAKLAGGRS